MLRTRSDIGAVTTSYHSCNHVRSSVGSTTWRTAAAEVLFPLLGGWGEVCRTGQHPATVGELDFVQRAVARPRIRLVNLVHVEVRAAVPAAGLAISGHDSVKGPKRGVRLWIHTHMMHRPTDILSVPAVQASSDGSAGPATLRRVDAEQMPLPEPDTAELRALVPGTVEQRIYGFLHRRRTHPPTMAEIEAFAAGQAGKHDTHVNRRVRVLREVGLDVPAVRDGKDFRYHLKGWRPGGPRAAGPRISDRTRAQVLAPQRCAQCGETPLEHGVVLVVDHKVPKDWGGGDEIENLQPLCERCNGGKRAWYQTYSSHSDEIRAAIGHEEVHRRIGELLKAFHGQWVHTELISIVASAAAYQEDYQKRTRELRVLGWIIEAEKRYGESARVRTYYRCTHWEPWPEGTISGEIRRREHANKAAKREGTS